MFRIEVGKKYKCRNREDVDYVFITNKKISPAYGYLMEGVMHFACSSRRAVTMCIWLEDGKTTNQISRTTDLVEEYESKYTTPKPAGYCDHSWVNVGFTSIIIACKSCGISKDDYEKAKLNDLINSLDFEEEIMF